MEFKASAVEESLEFDYGISGNYRFIYGKIGNQGLDINLGISNKLNPKKIGSIRNIILRRIFNKKTLGGWGIPNLDAGFELDISGFKSYIENEDWEGLYKALEPQIEAGIDGLLKVIEKKEGNGG